MGSRLWLRMHDSDNRGAFPIAPTEARKWNAQGFGIFWTVNEFDGARRIECMTRLFAWAVDMDAGTKDEMRQRLLGAPCVPSLVVETKRGFQAYWRAKDAKAAHWNAIVLDRLVAYYGADKNARDIARILRVPGFRHLKDPADPFDVRTVWEHDVAYTEQQIAERYPDAGEHRRHEEQKAEVKRMITFKGSDGFWDRVYALDCEEGLRRLSGHPAVRGEQFSFHRTRKGNRNIFVDGKGTSTWIDGHNRIGSLSHGGPTLYQWLTHPDYGNKPREAVEVLKSIFPELKDCQ